MADNSLERELTGIVGRNHVLTDPAVMQSYAIDWTGRYASRPRCVVRPADPEQVAETLRACAAAGVPLTPQGGNTGLVGGSVPVDGGVVLSLRRLDRIGAVDAAGRVDAGAGVTLSALQRHAASAGWAFGVDLAARDSATVGGMVATNAGGVRVVRHGPMRAQVMGVEVVFADGSVVRRMAGLAKDSTGYDLPGLLTGSEGTLGVVTEAALRLVPAYAERAVTLAGVRSVAAAADLLVQTRRSTHLLDAAELMLGNSVQLVCETTGQHLPLAEPHEAYLLIELAGPGATPERLADLLAAAGVDDAVVAADPAGRARLWRYREAQTESLARRHPVKLDVGVPLPRVAELVEAVGAVAAGAGAAAFVYGHLAEGNLHVNLTGAEAAGEEQVTDAVLRQVAELGGTISSEHGVGRAKRAWLHLTRAPADIAAMRAIKAALDPAGILNPGVLLP